MSDASSEPISQSLGFDALAQFARQNRSILQPNPLIHNELRTAFDQDLATAKAISFDIFDTLLVRRVAHPADVFLHLELHPAFRKHTFRTSIASLRAKAESLARKHRYEQHGTGEVVLAEIYAVFCELAQIPAEVVPEFVAAEESVELLLCRPNPQIQNLFRQALQTGKPILAISDTYHRRDFLVQLLASVGTPLDEACIFASSELRLNKQSGELFGKVLAQLDLKPPDLLHIGDHAVTDAQMPRGLGINAFWHGHHGRDNPQSMSAPPDSARLQSFHHAQAIFATRCSAQSERFWWQLGHTVFGPLLVGFASWLQQRFRHDGIERAYFLLRDGEIFHRVFEALFPSDSLPLKQLPSSRRAYVFPLLNQATDFVLNNLMACSHAQPIGEYLARVDLPAQEFLTDLQACGFVGPEQPLDARENPLPLHALLQRPRVLNALRHVSQREQAMLVGYLQQEGLLSPGRIALVDLGWNGTIHKAVCRLIDSLGTGPEVQGYYLALFPTFVHYRPPRFEAQAFLATPSESTPALRAIKDFPSLLEIVCSSNQGSLQKFLHSLGRYCPVLKPNPIDSDQQQALVELHEGILAFAHEYRQAQVDLGLSTISPDLAVSKLLHLMSHPTKEEAVQVGGLAHCDDFGTSQCRFTARFRPTSMTPEAIWEDFDGAYWKQGMLNQPCLQGSILRTLRWLMQP